MSWTNIYSGRGCPVCSGHQIGKRNSLAYKRPDLALEWHPCNKLNPEEVVCGSHERIYWVCSKCSYGENKQWFVSINSRSSGQGCPACSGRVVTDRNKLSILFPDIAKEWDYSKNKDIPNDVSYGSKQKRWWICSKGHNYFASINNRTSGMNCRQCADEKKESTIATELKSWCENKFRKLYYEEQDFEGLRSPKNDILKFDIFIEQYEFRKALFIEIHGCQHYKLSGFHYLQARKNGTTPDEEFKYCKKLDRMKRKFARKNGVYIEIDLRKMKTAKQAIDFILLKLG